MGKIVFNAYFVTNIFIGRRIWLVITELSMGTFDLIVRSAVWSSTGGIIWFDIFNVIMELILDCRDQIPLWCLLHPNILQ